MEVLGRLQVWAGEAPIKGGGQQSTCAKEALPCRSSVLTEKAVRTHHGWRGKPVALDVNFALLAR